MDSVLILVVIALMIANLIVVIFLLKRKQPEPTNNEQILKIVGTINVDEAVYTIECL